MAKLRGGSVFSTEKRRGKLRFAFRFCGTHYPSRAAEPDAAHISYLAQPRAPVRPANRPPQKPRRLRVAQNNHLHSQQLRVACNTQPQTKGIVPGHSGRVSPAAAPKRKINPTPPFLRRKDPGTPAPPAPPAASNTLHTPNRQNYQTLPKHNKTKNKKAGPHPALTAAWKGS